MRDAVFSWIPQRIYLLLLLIPGSLLLAFVMQSLRALLLMPLALLLVLIGNIVLRRRVRLAFGFCARHRRRRRIVLASACLLLIVAFASPWMPFWSVLGPGWCLVLAGFAFYMVYGSGTRPPVVISLDERYSRFSGCGEPFLASLPPLPARDASPDR